MISEIIQYDRSDECKEKIQALVDTANTYYTDRNFKFKYWEQEGNDHSEYAILAYVDDNDPDYDEPDEQYFSGSNNTYIYLDIEQGRFVIMHKGSIRYEELFGQKKHFNV